MRNEIIFYNGFNLLVDIIIAGAVFFLASRYYWSKGYGEGYSDCADHQDRAGHYYYEQDRENNYEGSK
jgi:hypothetical protein